MNKLVENQIDDIQVTANELEELYGGGSGLNCPELRRCNRLSISAADDDDNENIVF